jgi:WXG100 family type VII secretion target
MGSGDRLVVDFTALHQASVDIQHALGALDTELDQLERDAAPLVSTWDGDARRAYDVRQSRWRGAAADLSAMLRQIKIAVDESAADYTATEKLNTSMFT